ncbi:hypothetical protein CC80DRAFT_8339 [Byssothecium circinans]|uniref:Uncharacterized protein n=1 Tax=Byssothecium circinans TaxID=147558 RepID=A0A6A5UFZ5_9PLEO|nr:hypothetical protein CC80DRAFT_8339 [Byssothecium circinans]
METTDPPPAYTFADGHPTSPPMTPGSRTQARFPPQTSHTSPIYKRMGVGRFAQSPPLEFIEPIGQGPHFNFTRQQSRGASPSTASGRACATTPQDSEDSSADESDEESELEEIKPSRTVDEADVTFVLEELGSSEDGYDSDVEVVQPTHCEDAKSEKSEGMIEKFKDMQVLEGSSDEEERDRIYRRKKKRWSAGIFKRSHSQSIEGDSSYSDNDPLDDVDSTARRLRRRVRGPADRRASLVFEDRGFPNSNNIAEVEEPEDGWILHAKGPPSIPSDDAFTLDELPFWEVEVVSEAEETMDVEYESS